jgi:hypothetical protein
MQTTVVLAAVLFWLLPGCAGGPGRRVSASYDDYTRQLVALAADQDGDGRMDQWSYFDGARPLRGEKDADGDGRIDRWEYFDASGTLLMVGTSSREDGIEDTWTWPADEAGVGRVDRSRSRDRYVNRREFFVAGMMARAEEDTNGDGRMDRWDRYESGVLRHAEFDTTFASGRPDRRAVYDAGGRFERVEVVGR